MPEIREALRWGGYRASPPEVVRFVQRLADHHLVFVGISPGHGLAAPVDSPQALYERMVAEAGLDTRHEEAVVAWATPALADAFWRHARHRPDHLARLC